MTPDEDDRRPLDPRGRFVNRAVGGMMAAVAAFGFLMSLFLGYVLWRPLTGLNQPRWDEAGLWLIATLFCCCVLVTTIAARFAFVRLSGSPTARPPGRRG